MIAYEVTCRWGQVVYDNPVMVRDRIFNITTDPEIATEVRDWCEKATIGDVYTRRDFIVEVVAK